VCKVEAGSEPQPAWAQLRESDTDPSLNKTVHTLIVQDDNCFVYLDSDLYVEWEYDDNKIPDKEGSGAVFNRISLLESIPMRHLSTENQVAFKRMVGEALARLLTQCDLRAANEILDKAEVFINARNSEVARRWQLSAAAVVCAIALLVGGILWIERSVSLMMLGDFAFSVVIGACAGGLGATTSLLLRIRQMAFDVSAGRDAHHFDGAIRVLAGMAGAVVALLAVRVNLIGGIVNGMPHPFAALMLVCVIAGASERLVPDLINRLEGTFESELKHDKDQSTTQKGKRDRSLE
jgi:hypothetical protein